MLTLSLAAQTVSRALGCYEKDTDGGQERAERAERGSRRIPCAKASRAPALAERSSRRATSKASAKPACAPSWASDFGGRTAVSVSEKTHTRRVRTAMLCIVTADHSTPRLGQPPFGLSVNLSIIFGVVRQYHWPAVSLEWNADPGALLNACDIIDGRHGPEDQARTGRGRHGDRD